LSDTVQIKTDTVKLTIDGKAVEVPKGTLVIEAARSLAIEIPFFCYHQKLKSDGNCRMCLVSVEKMPKLQVSCSLPVSEGMVVHTNNPVVSEARKGVLDFLLANHPLDCPICDEGGRCPLQKYSQKYTAYGQFQETKRVYEKEYFSPLIEKEMNRCVQCMRCVRYCDEVIDSKALASVNRGYETEIGHYADKPLDCEFCGGCVQICPVGALLNRLPLYEYRPWMLTHTETTCAYCADGCSLRLESRPQTREVIEVTSFWGNETKSVWGKGRNEGDLCAKGYFGYPFVNSPKRLTKPLVRKDGRRDGPLVEVSWEEAIARVAEGFGRIKSQHGGAAFGALASARCTNENLYAFQKFVRVVLGSPNLDSSVRYGMVNAARAMTELCGTPRWLTSYEDITQADLIFVIGTDITQTNPIVGLKVKAAAKRGAKLIVATPLRPRISTLSNIVNLATRPLAHRPGSERAVAIGLVKAVLEKGSLADGLETHPSVQSLRKAVSSLSPKQIEAAAGVAYDQIAAAAGEWAAAPRAVMIFGESILRSRDGYQTVRILGELALLTGKLAAEGSGLAPLLDENNEMGAYEMGLIPDGLPGLGRPEHAADRDAIARSWNEPLPARPGLTMIEMLHAAREGKIKGFYFMGENPVGSLPASAGAAEAMAAAEFVVCQDLFLTETGSRAFNSSRNCGVKRMGDGGALRRASPGFSGLSRIGRPIIGRGIWPAQEPAPGPRIWAVFLVIHRGRVSHGRAGLGAGRRLDAIVPHIQFMLVPADDAKSGALIKRASRVEFDDADGRRFFQTARFREQQAQHLRANAAVLERGVDVQFLQVESVGAGSHLQISSILVVSDNDANLRQHEFSLEPRVLGGNIPSAEKPLSDPAHAGMVHAARKRDVGGLRRPQPYALCFGVHRQPGQPDSFAFTIPLAFAMSICPAYWPRKAPITLPMSFMPAAPVALIAASIAAAISASDICLGR